MRTQPRRALAVLLILVLGVPVLAAAPVRGDSGLDGDLGPHDTVAVETVTAANVGNPSCSVVTPASSLTFSHQTLASPNRLLLVAVFQNATAGASVSTLTYAGQSLTLQISQQPLGPSGLVEVWSLTSPPIGTDNVVVTLTAASEGLMALAASFAYVDLVAFPQRLQSFVSIAQLSVSDTLQSGTPPPSEHDFVLAFALKQGAPADAAPVPDSGQVQRAITYERVGAGPTCAYFAVATEQAVSASTAMGWSAANTSDWTLIMFSLHPTVPTEPEPTPTVTPAWIFPPLSLELAGLGCVDEWTGARCWAYLTANSTGVLIRETYWYLDSTYVGMGRADDPRQHTRELSPAAFPIGTANVTVEIRLDNGQRVFIWHDLRVDRSWILVSLTLIGLAIPMSALWRFSGRRRS